MIRRLRRRFAQWRLRRNNDMLNEHVETGYCHMCDMGVECQAVAAMEARRDYWQEQSERKGFWEQLAIAFFSGPEDL